MCTERPCKCSVDLHPVPDYEGLCSDGASVVGAFRIGWVKDGELRYRQFWIVLPCEGGELHGLPINAPGEALPEGVGRPMWTWDGNEHKPTISPSVLTWRGEGTQRQEVWHGFIKAGRAESC